MKRTLHKAAKPISDAVILSIGDELTLGQTVDSNSAWLSARLIEKGVLTVFHKTVPDELEAIKSAFLNAASRAPLVIATGGLGPTKDDLTRIALAKVAGTRLVLHAPSLHRIKRLFDKMGWPMSKSNATQAMCPDGATMLANNCGTAPGIRMRLGSSILIAMPGVPHEMKAMFARHVVPLLSSRRGRVILTETLRNFGLGESLVGEKLGSLMERGRNPQVGTTVSAGIVSVRVRSEFPTVEEAARKLNSTLAAIEMRLGRTVFGKGDFTLQQAVASLITAKKKTLATAESCTGGLLAACLTDIPGASDWYRGGWVVYSSALKHDQLDVPEAILKKHGPVSGQVARILAERCATKAESGYGLSTTGVAGPSGGTRQNPVGTVWIALARPKRPTIVERFRFNGTRDMVRDRAVKMALNMLRLDLLA